MIPSDEVTLEILGRQLRVNTVVEPEDIGVTVAVLERMFHDMEHAYELKWGILPSALDTSSWLLMGALNLAHHAVCLEREARQHTQNLEHTIDSLLSDVPDEVVHSFGCTSLNSESQSQ
jgi:cell division protein ZapA (FtsZ GTPase activity inhibitor)